MTFRIIDKKTGKEPTGRVIDNLAKKGNLKRFDIDGFAVCEDGLLILMDECGNYMYCDRKRFIVDAERHAHIKCYADGKKICSACHKETQQGNYCIECGAKLDGGDLGDLEKE